MAERSTAAVESAAGGGDEPLTTRAEQATADEAEHDGIRAADEGGERSEQAAEEAVVQVRTPELHSGHKLARRYRLEECVTRLDGFSSWRAVDEKLRRAVGVHLLPAEHPRARSVLAAARSSALLGDPRFVQVLDAVEENDLVYVVHEWLPDATELTAVLAAGALEAHEAYQLVSQLSQAMAAAHREGLAHLRLTPSAVLRTSTGQYRIRGLAVNAALRGIKSDTPQRADTEAIGALLYAALTQRWPYEVDAYGLSGLPKDAGRIAPDQVRAGVHRGLSELAMRALVNDGATASRLEQPCTTPEELAKAVAELPRIKPPEPAYTPAPEFRRTTYQQGSYARTPQPGATQPVPTPPAPLQSRTGKALKWAVSALLIAALGLGSWQLADALMERGAPSGPGTSQQPEQNGQDKPPAPKPLAVRDAKELVVSGSAQAPGDVGKTFDDDSSSYWRTKSYIDGPEIKIKPGVGIVYDLGAEQDVTAAEIKLHYGGDHTTLSLYAADSLSPGSVQGLQRIGAETTTRDTTAKVTAEKPVKTRYVVVWLTALPYAGQDGYSKPGHKQGITDVQFSS
ncbi:serine/threonine protein kinase [Streptomyces sp. KLOTTS4A1]|uniref:serine/threonine protein kinase n=1 Tax=Streptomyces sp. KLOTTS4A1 TaxID=3390996 RepID=UPI0039F4D70B